MLLQLEEMWKNRESESGKREKAKKATPKETKHKKQGPAKRPTIHRTETDAIRNTKSDQVHSYIEI